MTRAAFPLWLLLLPLLLGASCGNDFECDAETPCPFGEACIEGFCVEAQCATSAQCKIEEFCNANRQCAPGCLADDDCYPGDACVEGACEPEACVETGVDCGYKEFCNTATGDCYEAGGAYCRPCNVQSVEQDCGAENVCWNNYCGVTCDDGRECPAGFQCTAFVDQQSNVVGHWCITYCWLYEDARAGTPLESLPECEIPAQVQAP